jgi:PucR C-terminal helix-turn-helix domain/GGDEF-like domain
LARVSAISDPGEIADPEYVAGLSAAVPAALHYALAAIGHDVERTPPIPAPLLVQARLAARNGVGLDTVLRRYVSGYTLLGHFIVDEAERGGHLADAEIKRLLEVQMSLFDRLLAAVSEEYVRETQVRRDSAAQRRAERVERLLAGELVDTSELAYDLEATHIGLVAVGVSALNAVHGLAEAVDCRKLVVARHEGTIWGWLGAYRRLDTAEVKSGLDGFGLAGAVSLAMGESARGPAGWRLTHEQARAAMIVARRRPGKVVRYADVALPAAIFRDDLLRTSLRQLYLTPLGSARDRGVAARQTLRAYFAANGNITSTAAALGVSRRTVANRLHAIEERLGRPLNDCAADLHAALSLAELEEAELVSPPI